MRKKLIINNILGIGAILGVASVSSFFICCANNQVKVRGMKTNSIENSYFKDIEDNISSYSRQDLYSALNKRINDGWKRIPYKSLAEHIVNVDFDDDGQCIDIYSSEKTIKTTSLGSYHGEGDTWNKEHFIPKSWWGGNPNGPSGEGGDMFNMYAVDGYVNSMRSNYPLGEVSEVVNATKDNFSKLGYSRDLPNTYVFEINDQYKSWASHSYFYFACKNDVMNCNRSKYTDGNGATTFDANGTFGLTSYATNLFLKWNKNSTMVEQEKTRAEKVYEEQNNLNPFIYHPEWADFIWGGIALPTHYNRMSDAEIKEYINSCVRYSFIASEVLKSADIKQY